MLCLYDLTLNLKSDFTCHAKKTPQKTEILRFEENSVEREKTQLIVINTMMQVVEQYCYVAHSCTTNSL